MCLLDNTVVLFQSIFFKSPFPQNKLSKKRYRKNILLTGPRLLQLSYPIRAFPMPLVSICVYRQVSVYVLFDTLWQFSWIQYTMSHLGK